MTFPSRDDDAPPLPADLALLAGRLARDVPEPSPALRRRVLGSVVDALGEASDRSALVTTTVEHAEPWAMAVTGLTAVVAGLLAIPFLGSPPPSPPRAAPVGQAARIAAAGLDIPPSITAPPEATARNVESPHPPERTPSHPRRFEEHLRRAL